MRPPRLIFRRASTDFGFDHAEVSAVLAAMRNDSASSLSETERSQLHASVWAQLRSPTSSPSPASSRRAAALPAWRRLAYAGAAAVLALAVGGSLLPHFPSPSHLDSAARGESDSAFSTPHPGDMGSLSDSELSTFSTPPSLIDGFSPGLGTGLGTDLDTACLPTTETAPPPASTTDTATSPPPPSTEALPPRPPTTDTTDLPTTDPPTTDPLLPDSDTSAPDTPQADTPDHDTIRRPAPLPDDSAEVPGGVSCIGEVAPSPADVPPLPEPVTGGGVDGAPPTLPHPAER